jgi:hypothetical protein
MTYQTRDQVHPLPPGPEPAESIVPKNFATRPPLAPAGTVAPSIIPPNFVAKKPNGEGEKAPAAAETGVPAVGEVVAPAAADTEAAAPEPVSTDNPTE